jgi:hypothetical protein
MQVIGWVLMPLMAAVCFGLTVTDQDPVALAACEAVDAVR